MKLLSSTRALFTFNVARAHAVIFPKQLFQLITSYLVKFYLTVCHNVPQLRRQSERKFSVGFWVLLTLVFCLFEILERPSAILVSLYFRSNCIVVLNTILLLCWRLWSLVQRNTSPLTKDNLHDEIIPSKLSDLFISCNSQIPSYSKGYCENV